MAVSYERVQGPSCAAGQFVIECPMRAYGHVHHWLVDTRPSAGSYHATCKKCGARKDFPEEEPRFRFRLSRKPAKTLAEQAAD